MSAKKSKDFNFEKALTDLEQIVEAMETGQLPLETALKQFEDGIKLAHDCQVALQRAEQKVKILLEKNGQIELSDFEEEPE